MAKKLKLATAVTAHVEPAAQLAIAADNHANAVAGLTLDGVGSANGLVSLLPPGMVMPDGAVLELGYSKDGKSLLFVSSATNWLAADGNGHIADVYVMDVATRQVQLISSDAAGQQMFWGADSATFNNDATRVAFVASGDIYIKTLATGALETITASSTGSSSGPQFSPDGTKLAFFSRASELVAGDNNNVEDLFIKDLVTGQVTRIPLTDADGVMPGANNQLRFSPDGSKIVFSSAADGLVAGDTNGTYDIFVLDIATQAISLVSSTATGGTGNNSSILPTFTPDGASVVFSTWSSDILPGQSAYVINAIEKNLSTGAQHFVAGDPALGLGQGYALDYKFSADGKFAMFTSSSAEYFPNGGFGVVIHDLTAGTFTPVSPELLAGAPNAGNSPAAFSPDGNSIAFFSYVQTLVNGTPSETFALYLQSLNPQTPRGDHLIGGTGVDTATYETASAGLTIDLRVPDGSANTGVAFKDTYTSIEHFKLSAFDDTFYGLDNKSVGDWVDGGAGNDKLFGGIGSDRLSGGLGDDLLRGGAGEDTLIGGQGADTFAFSRSERGEDTIKDFQLGIDKISLEGIAAADVRLVQHGLDTEIIVKGLGAIAELEGVANSQALWHDILFV